MMNRQYDLDWIRVLATLAVFIYHCFMFFNPWAWHVKNNETDPTYITAISLFMSSWLMPIFFAVSGINSYYALQKRTGIKYIKERLARLGIPLLFGVMILTPPQIYMERVSHGQYFGSFFNWYPHYFDGVYLYIGGSGNFAFVGLHLWYLLVLLVFSLITLPLFIRKKPSVSKDLKPLHLIVLTIPLMIVSVLVDVVNLGGWDISFYLVIFLYGYFLFTKASFKSMVQRLLPITLALSILTTVLFVYGFMSGMPATGNGLSILLAAVKALNCWSWLLVIFAFADKKLSFTNKWMQYGNQASMPFYVFHQPVIVTIGFMIAEVDWSIPVKLVFLLSLSFFIIIGFYHFIISRIRFIRILFGMKGKREERMYYKPNVKI
ncbi:peptidoglycan/LPS O-acetylase OafA/YrhL [Bacillus niacini]|uniref:Peptidoglycan/LPS O-acetylase OafA/YrhL n=1 Tax=Neobacillus niacini TaxID=86668 RepID=A0A852T7F9_9BACI|nr:acyltransferase family protein [Neobacillus niacini]NYE04131.1 peptidoglycan/LPS O-acetylase OafA/YrhL [Neobacillus niacini]